MKPDVSIAAVMSMPRHGLCSARSIIETALQHFHIPLVTSQGVYWGKCQENRFQTAIDKGVDMILAVDYDSAFTYEQLGRLIGIAGNNDEIHALAALQPRQDGKIPLFSLQQNEDLEPGQTITLQTPSDTPFQVKTAHFGMTLIKTEHLKDVPHPWFVNKPPKDPDLAGDTTTWIDADINFWLEWEKAGKTVYVDPMVRMGHVTEVVHLYDDDFNVQRVSVYEWYHDPYLRRQGYRADADGPRAEAPEEDAQASSDEGVQGHCIAGCDPQGTGEQRTETQEPEVEGADQGADCDGEGREATAEAHCRVSCGCPE